MKNNEAGRIVGELQTHALILGGFVVVIWIVEFINFFFLGGILNSYGIRPHTVTGLRGILFAPFLHSGFPHLMANTLPFLVLGWLVMLRETSDFFVVTAITMLTSGLGVWLFGSPYSVHIGASGVIFGYFGFLLLRGYFERSIVSIIFSLFVGALYGSLIWGVLPLQFGISWEGHLFGFFGGVLAAHLLSRNRSTQR